MSRPEGAGRSAVGADRETADQAQRADSLAEHAEVGKQAGADLHGSALDAICELMRVSRRSYYLAAKLLRIGCAELVAEVEAGRMSLNLAVQIARATHDGQRAILAAIEGRAPRQRTLMVRLILADAERSQDSGLSQSSFGTVAQ